MTGGYRPRTPSMILFILQRRGTGLSREPYIMQFYTDLMYWILFLETSGKGFSIYGWFLAHGIHTASWNFDGKGQLPANYFYLARASWVFWSFSLPSLFFVVIPRITSCRTTFNSQSNLVLHERDSIPIGSLHWSISNLVCVWVCVSVFVCLCLRLSLLGFVSVGLYLSLSDCACSCLFLSVAVCVSVLPYVFVCFCLESDISSLSSPFCSSS